MTNQSILKILFISLMLAFCAQTISAQQGFQILQKANDRDLYHNCSSPLAEGGYYVISHYFVRNLADTIPDSIGIHVSKNDFKGEISWAMEYHLDEDDIGFEKYQKGIECLTMAEDTLILVAADLEAQETSSARIYLKIEPMLGQIVEQYRLEDISAEEEILTNLTCDLMEDHNLETYYMGTHNSDDVVGVHLERVSNSATPLSRSYFAIDSMGQEMDLSLAAGAALDTGFVFSAMLGDAEDRTAAMVQLDSFGIPVFASRYMLEDSLETNLQFTSIAAMPDSTFVHLGILTNVMNQSEVSTLVKTDSIGKVLWAKSLQADLIISQAQEIILTSAGELVVIGKYKDFGATTGDFALFLDTDGNVLREVNYESDVSAWTDEMNSADFDAMDISGLVYSKEITDPSLLITSQGRQRNGAWVPMVIKTDIEGLTLCNAMTTAHRLEDYTVLRDTLMIDQGQFVDRVLSDFFEVRYDDYNLATTSVQNITLCRNDVPKDTFLDATVMGVDSMFVSYSWSKSQEPLPDTTAILNINIPNTEDVQYTVVATVLDEVCFTLCDTTMVMFFPEPVAFIESRYDCDADASEKWLLTAGNSAGPIVSVSWQSTNGQVLGTDITISVPETPGITYQAIITDACGLTASTTWTAPAFPVASISADFSNICPVPGYITLTADMQPLYRGPLQFTWFRDGVEISNDESFEVREADLNGGAVVYSVEVRDDCGNLDMTTITLDPSDFELTESTLSIDRIGLNNQVPGCPFELNAVFVDGVTGGVAPQSYLWSPTGETTPNVAVTEPGDYTVTVIDLCDRELMMTVTITAADLDSPPPSAQINNIGFNPCDYQLEGTGVPGESNGLTFAIDSSGWTGPGGFTSPTGGIIVLEIGTYRYTVRDICGKTASASVEVTSLDIPDPTVTIANQGLNSQCYVNLVATGVPAPGLDAGSYSWSNADVGPASTATAPGTYTVTYTDQCGQTAVVEVTLTEADFMVEAPQVTIESSEVTEECSRTLTAVVTNDVTILGYEWSDGSTENTIEVTEDAAGTFSVTVTGCSDTGTAEFVADNAEIIFPDIFFPNSTSDGGVNATFGPEVTCPDFTDYKLEIFNRWGKRVFEADRFEDRWSGSLDNQGARLEEDVYLWQCTYTTIAGEQLQKGSVTSVPR